LNQKGYNFIVSTVNSFKIERPWGWFEQFITNKKCSVKIMFINHGECISLQRHTKRSQYYYILDDDFLISEGSLRHGQFNTFTVDQNLARAGDSFFFPKGKVHRAKYVGKKKYGRYLEISIGKYNEKDIERLEDKYGREKI
jgi:mannose-1-phosphate guanylyltransferase/mannose-6-phosphate isomerase